MKSDQYTLCDIVEQLESQSCNTPVIAMWVDIEDEKSEMPLHQHQHGQLVYALKGGVRCQLPQSTLIVPPQCAVWIPSGVMHSIHTTANAQVCYLFIHPSVSSLPKAGCTLSIAPLVRELILNLSMQPHQYSPDSALGRKALVLLEELAQMPIEHLSLVTPDEPRLQKIAKHLFNHPADRRTLAEWGTKVAMSERSLARLFKHETGMTFGRWRQQLHLIIAMHQLSNDSSVQSVADYLGYQSVTAFITMFKKAVGKPPAQYFSSLNQMDNHNLDKAS
ncbi:helix-turn-helix domain-containing protein [Vibrio sp. CAIM 722]|uniref:Helix-turn-helix domain-containing protein n=1 Tax=Vibrio eleionomae TaxID=2653505 RepID=A0A7X4LLI7_9VIBR|nr:helix-turn-helix transcriptional regulator [Vibrio eleionomae]MZI94183.1 helix-turn-helix domain-containing protein [Vibrio eleionomae]